MKWAVLADDQSCVGVWISYTDAQQFVSDNSDYPNQLIAIPAEELTEETALADC